jgi:hypothetical protein
MACCTPRRTYAERFRASINSAIPVEFMSADDVRLPPSTAHGFERQGGFYIQTPNRVIAGTCTLDNVPFVDDYVNPYEVENHPLRNRCGAFYDYKSASYSLERPEVGFDFQRVESNDGTLTRTGAFRNFDFFASQGPVRFDDIPHTTSSECCNEQRTIVQNNPFHYSNQNVPSFDGI